MKTNLEFPTKCGECGGPLMRTTTAAVFGKPRGPRLEVWVHARHRDWADAPHGAEPMVLASGRLTIKRLIA